MVVSWVDFGHFLLAGGLCRAAQGRAGVGGGPSEPGRAAGPSLLSLVLLWVGDDARAGELCPLRGLGRGCKCSFSVAARTDARFPLLPPVSCGARGGAARRVGVQWARPRPALGPTGRGQGVQVWTGLRSSLSPRSREPGPCFPNGCWGWSSAFRGHCIARRVAPSRPAGQAESLPACPSLPPPSPLCCEGSCYDKSGSFPMISLPQVS